MQNGIFMPLIVAQFAITLHFTVCFSFKSVEFYLKDIWDCLSFPGVFYFKLSPQSRHGYPCTDNNDVIKVTISVSWLCMVIRFLNY